MRLRHTKNRRYLWITLSAMALVCIFCSKNPFQRDETIAAQIQKISGQVQLSDQSNPQNVLIWMEGLDLTIRADSAGFFTLQPNASITQPYQGLDGLFRLYYYAVNYRLDYSEIFLQKGRLMPGKGDVDNNGVLRGVKTLHSLLNITVQISPDKIPSDFKGVVEIELVLRAFRDPVRVYIPAMQGKELALAFIKNISNPDTSISILSAGGTADQTFSIDRQARAWQLNFWLQSNRYATGTYQIIPIFWIEQDGIPDQLLAKVPWRKGDFGPQFLKLPYEQQGGYLQVEASN